MALRDMTIKTIDTSIVPHTPDHIRRLRPGGTLQTRRIALSGILAAGLLAPGLASAQPHKTGAQAQQSASGASSDQSVLVKRNARIVQRERSVAGLKAEPQADRILARIYKATLRDTAGRLAVVDAPSTHPDSTVPTAFLPSDLSRRVHHLPETERRQFMDRMSKATTGIVRKALETALSDADATLAVLPQGRPLSDAEETTFISSVSKRAENEAIRSAADTVLLALAAPAAGHEQTTTRRLRM